MSGYHKTDGKLLGSCGDIRDPNVEIFTALMAQHVANGLVQATQGFASLLAARREKKKSQNCALEDHAMVARALAAQEQQQPKPEVRHVFSPSFAPRPPRF